MTTWWTPLIRAVNDGALDEVKRIISTQDLCHLVEWPSNDTNYSASDLLCIAISKNHTEIAEELLKCGIPVNEPSKCGCATPLHMAVLKENIKFVDILLERNADIFAKRDYQNPLQAAVKRKNVKIAELLLNRAAHLNTAQNCARREYGSQSAFTACSRGYDELVELFVSRGSEIRISRMEMLQLLIRACELGKPSLVKLLGKYVADINAKAYGRTALETAVEVRSLAAVECILDFCPDINRNTRVLHQALTIQDSERRNMMLDVLLRYGFTVRPEDTIDGKLLKDAIRWERLDIVEALLKCGADVNASCQCLKGSTFLCVAAENHRLEVAKLLIAHGADLNIKHKRFETPIYVAVRNLDVDMTRLFLSRGAVIENMHNLLTEAFQFNGMRMVDLLLQHDPTFDMNAICKYGITVLHTLIDSTMFWNESYSGTNPLEPCKVHGMRMAEMAELFLRRGANVDLKSVRGDTALCAAIHKNLPLLIEKLLEYGAEVDAQYDAYENKTPLMIAVNKNNLSVVQSLLKGLPDSQMRDLHGKTALHHAAEFAWPSIVQELLDYGADINATSKDNTTPYTCDTTEAVNRVVLERHIHKMKALNLYVNSKNLERFNLQTGLSDDCKREIEEMKCTKISDSHVSFYDVLTRDTLSLINYVKNQNVVSALNKRNDYENVFPMYSAMIHRRFLKSMKRGPLLTPGVQSLDSLIGIHLLDDVSEQLLCYLSLRDLRNLIKASPRTD